MSEIRKVGLFIGSLRKDSFTRKMANALIEVAPRNLDIREIGIGDVSHYNQDLETAAPPADWVKLRNAIAEVEALIFATPEYNRSVPGTLKNAIDVASRPRERNVFDGKPGMVVSVSPGALSAFGANHHLRQCLVFLNVPTLQQPEMYLGGVARMFDDSGKLTNDNTREFLTKGMAAFAAWIEKIRPMPKE
jgi:chromate reductase, NAD(P)H dehydrogenase (quinone)